MTSRVVELLNGTKRLVANFTLAIISPLNGDILKYDNGEWKNSEPTPNFSYHTIPMNKKITIPVNQQMIVEDGIQIIGELEIKGSLILR